MTTKRLKQASPAPAAFHTVPPVSVLQAPAPSKKVGSNCLMHVYAEDVLPVFAFLEGKTVKKIRMCFPNEKTFREGFEEYIKARNLRDGTINHYQESIKQIYKRITPDTLISSMCQQTMANFYISLRDDPNLNEVSMGTYARDLKTLMRFFIQA